MNLPSRCWRRWVVTKASLLVVWCGSLVLPAMFVMQAMIQELLCFGSANARHAPSAVA